MMMTIMCAHEIQMSQMQAFVDAQGQQATAVTLSQSQVSVTKLEIAAMNLKDALEDKIIISLGNPLDSDGRESDFYTDLILILQDRTTGALSEFTVAPDVRYNGDGHAEPLLGFSCMDIDDPLVPLTDDYPVYHLAQSC